MYVFVLRLFVETSFTGFLDKFLNYVVLNSSFISDIDFHATQRGTAPDHRMADQTPRLSKPQVGSTTQSQPTTSITPKTSQAVGQLPIGMGKTPTGKACGAALGAIYYPIAGQQSSANTSSISSDSTSVGQMPLPNSRSYETADTLERADFSDGFHKPKGDKRFSCPAATTNISQTHKVARPITTFNPQDREKYKTAQGPKKESQVLESQTPARSVHSDMYSTAFALQSLGDGTWPTYLNKVRSIWDDQFQHHSADNIHEKSVKNGTGVTGVPPKPKRSLSTGQYVQLLVLVPVYLEC